MDPYKDLRSYGETLIDSVDITRAEVVAARALAAPSAGLFFRRRLVAIAAATATFVTGNLGVAMAADSAVPGDLLYSVDRAYEKLEQLIGLGSDHTVERLSEAAHLASEGNRVDALDAVIDQFEDLKSDPEIDVAELDSAVEAIAEARDRTHEVGNETAESATKQAKEIVDVAHEIAVAVHEGDRAAVRELIEELKALARANGQGQNNGQGQDKDKDNGHGKPDDRGNGGDRGNSEKEPKP